MDYFSAALPIQQVAGYMCQPSPPQSTAIPPNIYPPLIPTAPPHEIAIRKMPPCTIIPSTPYPANAIGNLVHLPPNLMQALKREPFQYNRDDMVSTCSGCGQTNTLWDLRVKKMADDLAEDHALKRYLMQEIRFEVFPGEEPPHSVANNIGYPAQPTDLCKMSNLRANANEFTPAQVIILCINSFYRNTDLYFYAYYQCVTFEDQISRKMGLLADNVRSCGPLCSY